MRQNPGSRTFGRRMRFLDDDLAFRAQSAAESVVETRGTKKNKHRRSVRDAA
jgi:hypothetical protein